MSKRRRLALVTVIAAAAVVAACWFMLGWGTRRFQGRTEREWIQSLRIRPDSRELGRWQALGPQAPPMLSRAMQQGAGTWRRKYAALWFKLPHWLNRLLPKPADTLWIRRNALQVLSALQSDIAPAAPALARALNDDDPAIREKASALLAALLPKLVGEKRLLLLAVVVSMSDQNASVRENATRCLAASPECPEITAPALARAMNDPDQSERYLAAQALSQMDVPPAARGGTAECLMRCLTSRDMYVRVNAAAKLSQMRQNPEREIPAFIEMLGDPLPAAQCVAAMSLGRYGADARPAVPALLRAMKQGEPRVRNAASNALALVNPAVLSPTATNSGGGIE